MGEVNAQGVVRYARVLKSNWDGADQRGVLWAVRKWRFAPLVVNGRPTPFQIVARIRVPRKHSAKAICGGLLGNIGNNAGGKREDFSPFTWVLEPVRNAQWIVFSVSRVRW